jgi:hypothetical protein
MFGAAFFNFLLMRDSIDFSDEVFFEVMKYRLYMLTIALSLAGLVARPAAAQYDDPLNDVYLSYIYAAVMGSGTYDVDGRKIAMLRIPFSYTQRKVTEEQVGVRWTLPVVIGYDAFTYEDWLDRLLDDEMVTLTIMPGFEVAQHYTPNWVFKPFGNIGMGFDFIHDEPVLMGVLGIRMLGTYEFADTSELRLGSSVRYAAEYQIQADEGLGFTMVEVGADYRRDAHLRVFSRDTNAGVYWRTQLFLPKWRIQRLSPEESEQVKLIHEIGVSVGLKKTYSKWGLTISRIRTGFQFGDNVRGWTFGTEFPF